MFDQQTLQVFAVGGGAILYFGAALLVRSLAEHFFGQQAAEWASHMLLEIPTIALMLVLMLVGGLLVVVLWGIPVAITLGVGWVVWQMGRGSLHLLLTPRRYRYHRLWHEYFGKVSSQGGVDRKLRKLAESLADAEKSFETAKWAENDKGWHPDWPYVKRELKAALRKFRLACETARYFGFEIREGGHTAYLPRRGLKPVDGRAA